MPTQQEENQNPSATDGHYEACTFEIIRRTRDVESFPLLFQTLISYGLQRNLLGLKWVGIATTLLSLVTSWPILAIQDITIQNVTAMSLVTLIDLGLLLTWLLSIRESRVKYAAEEYARHLFEAALSLEGE